MHAHPIARPTRGAPRLVPLYVHAVRAGFPSPGDDYIEAALDLNDLLIRNHVATYLVRAQGSSMEGLGIHDGDVLVVDASIEPSSGDIVVAVVDGAFTVKRLRWRGRRCVLEAADGHPNIELEGDVEMAVMGVVTYSLTAHRRGAARK